MDRLILVGWLPLVLAMAACGSGTVAADTGADPGAVPDAGAVDPGTDDAPAADADGTLDLAPPPDAPDDPGAPDPTVAAFDPKHVLEVAIELAPADWDALAAQTRSVLDVFGPGCLAQPFPDPFTYFRARVTLDGTPVDPVGVRKKGFLGSLSRTKPSLILKLDEFTKGQQWSGIDRLVLNNNQQDASTIHQCLGYEVLAAAGVPAPRCHFAHVTVNGRDLGLYTHVEGIRKDFLARHFADPTGNLYEGTLSDFRPGWDQTFEQKTNESVPDRGPLDALSAALATDDAGLLEALAPIVDVDRFLTFWAAEILIGHWDGYAGDTNNYYVYRDPATGRLQFLPWGIDNTFGSADLKPQSVMARGLLARRLYLLPQTRAQYVARLKSLLDQAWHEADLLAEADRMEALVAPLADPDGKIGLAAQVEAVRTFIRGRRAQLLAELEPVPPVWGEPLRTSVCFRDVGTAHATFSTTWGPPADGDLFSNGTATIVLAREDGTPAFAHQGVMAGPDQDGRAILMLVGHQADDTLFLVPVWLPPALVAPGVYPVGRAPVEGQVMVLPPSGEPYPWAFLDGGTLTLDAASAVPGAPVSGTLDANLMFW